jgi:hypothetical protein
MDSLTQYLPIITIFGPIIGALIGAAITLRFVVKRKRVTFYLYRTEDLTSELRKKLSVVVLRLNNRDVTELNRGTVMVRNSGNAPIINFQFDIMIPGEHELRLADKFSEDSNLHQAIDIAWDDPASTYNHRFKIKVPYFNPKENFTISVFFDKNPDDLAILCRIEDVKCKIRDPDYIYSNTLSAAFLRGLLRGIGGTYISFDKSR